MIEKLKNIIFLKTMYSKLMAGFLLTILIVSSFHLYSYKLFYGIVENEITHTIDAQFDKVIVKYDKYYEQVKVFLSQLKYEPAFYPVVNGQELTFYDKKILIDKLIEYKNKNKGYVDYIKTVFIVTDAQDEFIVSSEATYKKQVFFDLLFKNSTFTEAFWLNEMKKPFIYKIYPSDGFIEAISPAIDKGSVYMPVAYKKEGNSSFLLVALIDINALAASIETDFMENFYIYGENKTLLYPAGSDINIEESAPSKKSFVKTQEGYLFSRYSPVMGLEYYKLVPNTELKRQLSRINTMFKLILIISFTTSAFISALIVFKVNNPVKQIGEIIKSSKDSSKIGGNSMNFEYIRDNVRQIVTRNNSYINDLNSKNSMLKTFFYQAALKDVYLHISELKDQFAFANNYALFYFKIQYRDTFFTQIQKETSEATFFLKELIEQYIDYIYSKSITFQIENDQIISIVNIEKDSQDIHGAACQIVEKLKSEAEYTFFTIAVSPVYSEISDLKKAYNKLFEIVKFRKPLNQTQLLFESDISTNENVFYFLPEQVERFTGLLSSNKGEQCVQLMKSIFECNRKKEVNHFFMRLLCTEIVNCCLKVLIKMFYRIPECFDVNNIYSSLERCSTVDEYEKLCEDFIVRICNYGSANKKEADYIIDFIVNYVDQHYMEDICLDLFADKLNLSSAYISSYFKEKLAINLMDYINNLRIKKAIELLENTNNKIAEVAVKVGIPNITTFNRTFRKYTGHTPKDYRKGAGDSGTEIA